MNTIELATIELNTEAHAFESITTVRNQVTIPIGDGNGTFITFKDLKDDKEHFAIAFGDWKNQAAPLVRIHSECITGDVFFSKKCDCGQQLNEAVQTMQKTSGILLYLRQEGRGIGLYNKLDAYVLQQAGFDTYEANQMLGFDHDLRDYEVAAQMLHALGKTSVKLLTNNPEKVAALEFFDVEVTEQTSTGVFVQPHNQNYLRAKINKTGHFILLDQAVHE
jgi:GTP cyclohydrolase II